MRVADENPDIASLIRATLASNYAFYASAVVVGVFEDEKFVVTAPATYIPTSQVIVLENVFIRLSLTESAVRISKTSS